MVSVLVQMLITYSREGRSRSAPAPYIPIHIVCRKNEGCKDMYYKYLVSNGKWYFSVIENNICYLSYYTITEREMQIKKEPKVNGALYNSNNLFTIFE